jgi:hypothetical protein
MWYRKIMEMKGVKKGEWSIVNSEWSIENGEI